MICARHGPQPASKLVCRHLAWRVPGPMALDRAVHRRRIDGFVSLGWWLCNLCSRRHLHTPIDALALVSVCEQCLPTATIDQREPPTDSDVGRPHWQSFLLSSLSTWALRQHVAQMLEKNPFLEIDGDAFGGAVGPEPGRPSDQAEANAIVADVIAQKSGHSWKAVVNPEAVPRLRVRSLDASPDCQLRSGGGQTSVGPGPAAQLQEARWFMKNIQRRFDTIRRVSQAIVDRQTSFLNGGEIGAIRLVLINDIAVELGVPESTIHRTTGKYLATPFGTFELGRFLAPALASISRYHLGSTVIPGMVKRLVDAEDKAKPLSDSQLSHILEEQGVLAARRMIAKYRDMMKIAPANMRRSL
jgi:DNA-directed RNA polymerase specialized sigma54-like protein